MKVEDLMKLFIAEVSGQIQVVRARSFDAALVILSQDWNTKDIEKIRPHVRELSADGEPGIIEDITR